VVFLKSSLFHYRAAGVLFFGPGGLYFRLGVHFLLSGRFEHPESLGSPLSRRFLGLVGRGTSVFTTPFLLLSFCAFKAFPKQRFPFVRFFPLPLVCSSSSFCRCCSIIKVRRFPLSSPRGNFYRFFVMFFGVFFFFCLDPPARPTYVSSQALGSQRNSPLWRLVSVWNQPGWPPRVLMVFPFLLS